ncbi:hypothetical protein [Commensalibacter communis]|uniref:hypothetical protein n=1 Tax=Commensalibacter communis TaxID=2972786 RepID=UPI0022FFB086|nr:hypothetical protein [Commensalibacter communis]CAI3933566.1 Uncharacterized protein R83540S59_LOCUS695 [Commensalibacter communis]CAI3944640.1 Uncharacterized protein LMG28296_LOCUS1353 [Commensalibacter communis]
MARRKKYIEGPKLIGVQSQRLAYGKILARLLNEINKDIKTEVLPLYAQINNGRVHDGLFSGILIAINRLIEKYSNPIDVINETEKYSQKTYDYVFQTYNHFKRKNDLSIDWNPSEATRKRLDQSISDNVDLIKTIPKRYLENVKKEFSKATAKGWDMQRINKVLTERHGISRRHAFNIAIDQQNKVINDVSKQVNEDAGLFWVKWIHRSGVRSPRHSHLMADGTIFDLREGCLIDGEKIQPGEMINCHCFSVPVIPTEVQRRSIALDLSGEIPMTLGLQKIKQSSLT